MLLSSRRLTLTSGIEPPVKPTTTSAAALAQRAQAVGEAVAADRVEHDVDAAAGELLDLVLPRRRRSARPRRRRPRARPAPSRRSRRRRSSRAPRPLATCSDAVPTPPAAPCTSTVSPSAQPPAQLQREVGRVVVEDQRRRPARSRARRAAGRSGTSGATATSAKPPSMQNAATRSPGANAAPSGALRTTPADLAARHERQRRLELVLAARLQHLGERRRRRRGRRRRTPSPGVSMCEASGSGDVDELERRVGAGQLGDLDGAHGRAARYRFAHHRVSTP